MEKPRQGFWGLWNISFGFFGIQIGFALQNANASRIFQSMGTSIDDLALLWIAAPLTGLLVQPLVGHYSDRTWSPLGRRRPYFLAGAILSTLALFVMPNAPALWVAAVTLWVLDGSLNISMEPFRAFVGDMLGKRQRAAGYAFQTAFIGAGAVVASVAPYVFEKLGVSNVSSAGDVPDTVRYGFYFGGAMLLAAVLWTVFSTREYAPEQMAAFDQDADESAHDNIFAPRTGPWWVLAGLGAAGVLYLVEREGVLASAREAYLVAGGLAFYGLAQMVSAALVRAGKGDNALSHIISDLATMPPVMRRLALAQFLTWGALIIMWIYTTPVIAERVWNTTDASSEAFNQAGNWVGILFAAYSAVATVAAFLLPPLARRIGPARTHMIALLCGAAAYASLILIRDQNLLLVPMIGVGIAWASILSMPYVILANALPQRKLGIYMGIFNFFIVLPQLLIATLMGALIKAFFPGQPVWTMAIAAGVMALAALAMLRVNAENAAG
ncbi:MAG: MFS transporter [Pseudomonadota bacterium]